MCPLELGKLRLGIGWLRARFAAGLMGFIALGPSLPPKEGVGLQKLGE